MLYHRLLFVLIGLILAVQTFSQPSAPNNILRGRVLYQSSGNKPAVGVTLKEKDCGSAISDEKGEFQLVFQTKRNGVSLYLEIEPYCLDGKRIELVNEKEVKAAKLPASADEVLDIIVCPAGQRDIAAQKYYRILRTSTYRELEKKKKEVEALLAQKEKDYQKISELFAQLDAMQAALDSAKIREQASSIASINLDRASQLVKDAVHKIEAENDVEGALIILNSESLEIAYRQALEKSKAKTEADIRQVIEGYHFKISLLEPQYKYGEIASCYEKIAEIYEKGDFEKEKWTPAITSAAYFWGRNGDYQKQLECAGKTVNFQEKAISQDDPDLANAYNSLAGAYSDLGMYPLALSYAQKAVLIQEKNLPADHPDVANSYNRLARAKRDLGEYQKSLEYHLKALAIQQKALPPDHPDPAIAFIGLSATYGRLEMYDKELEYALKAVECLENALPDDHPDVATSYTRLGEAYSNLGEHQKSLDLNLKALGIRQKVLQANHPDIAASYANLGITCIKLKKYPEAKDALEKGEGMKADEKVNRGWAMYYALQNDKEKAIENLQKAVALGSKDLKWLETEPDLKNIRKEKGYNDLVMQLKKH